METKNVDDQRLDAYLLGTLPEEEMETIAEQYFINDGLFERLLEVESDLIHRYTCGRLPSEDQSRLESYLRVLPEAWREVNLARGSAQAERAAAAEPLVEKPAPAVVMGQYPAPSTSLWQTLTGWVTQPAPALVMALGLITLGGVLWMILYGQQLNQDGDQLLAQMRERDARQTVFIGEIERKLTEEKTHSAQLQQELERERRRREAQPPVHLPAFSLPMIRWSLSSTTVRGPDLTSEALRLDRKAKTVALIIPDKGERKYTGYKVELRTADGRRILWKDSQPYTPPFRRGRNIVFYRPASDFVAASYKLTLDLISGQGTTTRDYYFTVA